MMGIAGKSVLESVHMSTAACSGHKRVLNHLKQGSAQFGCGNSGPLQKRYISLSSTFISLSCFFSPLVPNSGKLGLSKSHSPDKDIVSST